ncbi:MAG: NlpC/P60 family protein [candidate division Zixibacteria bacterium]|nr:NlpC/P60 family protein [candidate division Zixibacteria bacterium]
MRSLLIIFFALTFLAGCVPAPRYRTGEATPPKRGDTERERPYRPSNQADKFEKVSTSRLLDLGAIIQSYLGRPYSGTSRYDDGLDCSRFTSEVFRKFDGIELPRTVEQQYEIGAPVSRERLRYGDLVFFRTQGRVVSHVGIYVGYNEFVHSSSSTGVIISSTDDSYWKKRFMGARRLLQ